MKKTADIHYGIHASPFGKCFLAILHGEVCALAFLGKGGEKEEMKLLKKDFPGMNITRDQKHTSSFVKKIFTSSKKKMSIPFVLHGTDFEIKVWDALSAIPEGETRSYADIAKVIGTPKAVRAVGTACGANRIAYLIPCHRVLPKNGSVGPYRWGSARKKDLLAWESSRQ